MNFLNNRLARYNNDLEKREFELKDSYELMKEEDLSDIERMMVWKRMATLHREKRILKMKKKELLKRR